MFRRMLHGGRGLVRAAGRRWPVRPGSTLWCDGPSISMRTFCGAAASEELSGAALREKKKAAFSQGGAGAVLSLDHNDIVLTRSCVDRIKLLNSKSEAALRLRLYVEGGGCSGFSYQFELMEDEPDDEDDMLFGEAGAQLVVDDTSFELLKGSTVDYTEEMISSSFQVVANPNAEAGCGCGTSFSLKSD